MNLFNRAELYEAGADAFFGLICISLVVIAIWAMGRLWPKHGKSPIIIFVAALSSTPFLLAAFVMYSFEKRAYFKEQAFVNLQKQTELCSATPPIAREKIIRTASIGVSAIWVKQGGKTMVITEEPDVRLAQEIIDLVERDSWFFDMPISGDRKNLPANALQLVVTHLEPQTTISRAIDAYPMQVSLYEGNELIAQRTDYWHRDRESCDIIPPPGAAPSPRTHYSGFFSRVLNKPDAIPVSKSIHLDIQNTKESAAKLPAVQATPQPQDMFTIKPWAGLLSHLPSHMYVDKVFNTVWVKTSNGLLQIRQPFEVIDVQMDGDHVVMLTHATWDYGQHQLFVFDENSRVLHQSRVELPPLPEHHAYGYTGSPFKISEQGMYFAMQSHDLRYGGAQAKTTSHWFLIEREKLPLKDPKK
jgi:hypothetical protein